MTKQEREQVRISLVRYAAAAGGNGMNAGLFLQYLRSEGFKGVSPGEVLMEVGYLVDKGFLAEVSRLVSPEIKAWRVTAGGRDFLAELGVE